MQRGILPLLPTKGGEGRGEEGRFYLDSPLPNPLPTRSSRGEGEDPKRQCRLIQWQWGSRVRGHASSTGCESPCTGSGVLRKSNCNLRIPRLVFTSWHKMQMKNKTR